MKKALSIFVLSLGFLAFENIAYAQPEIDACWNYNNSEDYERAVRFGKIAVEKYPENASAHGCLGLAYYNVGELKLAYEALKKAASLTDNKEVLMYIYNQIGLTLEKMGYLDDAIPYFRKSISLAKDLGNKDMQFQILNYIGMSYKNKGELDKALSYYEESLSLLNNEKEKVDIYGDIASIYAEKGDYKKAINYYQKAIEIAEKYGDYRGASIQKLNLGDTYTKMKDYKKAKKYLSEGLEGVKKAEDKFWEGVGYLFFGKLYKDKGDIKTAKEYYTSAYDLYKSLGVEVLAEKILEDIKKLDKSK
ncbi:tetratricopeptide repeat protein [Sulfurihydrogenibium yellowstonense]|uniref:Tetratricopeptide repeat domain protein n=1 Tax=Sulfurihydrogenibium yellowstonense SS-5 TaxID=432331 RepID=C4FL64_9AQUI|nr:tetratricopeptide repeat protein [Sulfurihydrogenibium yellowstonense]EEP60185.1 tetratricopeptide repeat domain protein [Sulfurihydrogenibium yellowstonense SS-5]